MMRGSQILAQSSATGSQRAKVIAAVGDVLAVVGTITDSLGVGTAGATLSAIARSAPRGAFDGRIDHPDATPKASNLVYDLGGFTNTDIATAHLSDGQALLKKAEQGIEAQLDPVARDAYLKIVNVGMSAAMAGGLRGTWASLENSASPITHSAVIGIGLALNAREEAADDTPIRVIIFAAATLVFQTLDFCRVSKIVDITNEDIVRAAGIFADMIFGKFGISQSMLSAAAGRSIPPPPSIAKGERKCL